MGFLCCNRRTVSTKVAVTIFKNLVADGPCSSPFPELEEQVMFQLNFVIDKVGVLLKVV